MPFCLAGALNSSNGNAIDWHNCGIVAYGCQHTLIFVDVSTSRVFQTLTKHYAPITHVQWQPARSFDDVNGNLRCASADSAGHLIVWEVISGQVASKFFSQNHAVVDMKWLNWEDTPRDFLLVLHSKTLLTLYNTNTGEQVWECRLGFNAFGFSLDPFKSAHAIFHSTGSSIVFVSDLKLHRPPAQTPASLGLRSHEQAVDSSFCSQLVHHRAYPDLAFAVFKDEIFCINTALRQVIFDMRVETAVGITALLPCSNRDAFYLVRSNGVVSLHIASTRAGGHELDDVEFVYEKAALSEVHRSSAKAKVVSAAICPLYETHVVLVYNTGKVVFNELKGEKETPDLPLAYRLHSIADHVALRSDLRQVHSDLRIRQSSQIYGLSGAISVVRMRPMVVSEQAADQFASMHVAALASATGVIHLVDVLTCTVIRSFMAHATAIKAMEWAGPNLLLSASTSTSLSSSSTVRNDIFVTDIRTGQKKRFRPEAEESAIELVRVSYFHRYVSFAFRHEPLEIWDVASMRLLRRMSKRCPIIIDMAWFGKNAKGAGEDGSVIRENLVVLDVDNHLYHVVVKGLHVRDGKEVNTEWKSSTSLLRCVAWKDDVLVFGDSTGRIRIWDLVKKQSRQTDANQNARGAVIRCAFTHLTGDKTLAVQYPSGVLVYDVDNLQLLQTISFPGMNVVDVDLCGVTPVYVSSDGFLRYSTPNNNLCLPVEENALPLMLRPSYRRALLQSAADGTPIPDEFKPKEVDEEEEEDVYSLLSSKLAATSDFTDRLQLALLFIGQQTAADLLKVVGAIRAERQMPCRLWMFWQKEPFKKRMEFGTRILMKRCQTVQHLELIIEKAIVLGKASAFFYALPLLPAGLQKDWATYMLLNFDRGVTPNENRFNALKACLLASDLQKEEAQCLVKLTATNLIASNFISDGVQLLYLIDQGHEACKYVASQGDWARSYSYGKLQSEEASREIVGKFISHVYSEKVFFKTLVAFLYASLGDWKQLQQTLEEMRADFLASSIRRILDQTAAA